MMVAIRIESPANEKGVTWHLLKTFDFRELPIPIAGDTIYVDEAFLEVTSRCISPTEAGTEESPRIEVFARVRVREEFERLESIVGWKPD